MVYADDVHFGAAIGYYDLNHKSGHSYADYSASLYRTIQDMYIISLNWTSTNRRHTHDSADCYHIFITVTAIF